MHTVEKVNWTWELGVYVPLCPYCNELAYEKDRCAFCGKAYEWVEGKYKNTVVAVGDYTVVQATNYHITIYENGKLVYHAAYNKKLTEDELRKEVDFLKLLRGGNKNECSMLQQGNTF
jgi:hypothetical protein